LISLTENSGGDVAAVADRDWDAKKPTAEADNMVRREICGISDVPVARAGRRLIPLHSRFNSLGIRVKTLQNEVL
jgi:hypothetical protein